MRFSKAFICSALILGFFVFEAAAQAKEKIASGDYGSLIIGIDAENSLTGYFNEATGIDEKGNASFTCSFFISGASDGKGGFDIRTWYPEDPDEVVEGVLRRSDSGSAINIKLEGEHGGCWNVAPDLKDESGLDFTLTKKGDWIAVRVVSSKRVYLFKSIDAGAPQKIFVENGEVVQVLETHGDWAKIKFVSPGGRSAYGWMKKSEFYGL